MNTRILTLKVCLIALSVFTPFYAQGKLLQDSQEQIPIENPALSPDGNLIASIWEDKVYLWETKQRKPHGYFFTGDTTKGVTDLRFTPDRQKLLVCQSSIHLFDVASGDEILSFKGHLDVKDNLAISPDSKYVLLNSLQGNQNSMDLWSLETGNLIHQFVSGSQNKISACFSSDSQQIITWSNMTIAWDIKTGEKVIQYPDYGNVLNLFFSPDNQTMVVFNGNAWLICDSQTGVIHKELPFTNNGILLPNQNNLLLFKFNPEKENTLILSIDIDSGTLSQSMEIQGELNCIPQMTDSERYILCERKDGVTILYDLKYQIISQRYFYSVDDIFYAKFINNGKQILAGEMEISGRNAVIFTANLEGKILKTFPLSSLKHIYQGGTFDLSPDEKTLAVNLTDIFLINYDTGKIIKTFQQSSTSPFDYSIQFSPDGKNILHGGGPGTYDVLQSVETGNIVSYFRDTQSSNSAKIAFQPFCEEPPSVRFSGFSPNGKNIMTLQSLGSGIAIWDAASLTRKFLIPDTQRNTYSAEYSKNGQYIIVTNNDNIITLYSSETGEKWRSFQQEPSLYSSALTLDNRYLFCCVGKTSPKSYMGYATSIQVWDTSTGSMTGEIMQGDNNIFQFDFSPDGKKVLLVGKYSLEVFDVDNLIATAKGQTSSIHDFSLYR